MSGFVRWLPGVLRAAGVAVRVVPGAETRSTRRSGFTVEAVVWHHTATGPRWTNAAVEQLLLRGNATTPGPLSQVGIERDGTWVVVACGRCNHNGYGTYGNDSIGLEFYNDGVGEPWPAVQVNSGVVGTRAIVTHIAHSEGRRVPVLGHKETDPRRKVDPAGIDMDDIRRRIAATEEDNMSAEDSRKIAEIHRAVTAQGDKGGLLVPTWQRVAALLAESRADRGRKANVDVDVSELADLLRDGLGDEIAGRVADELGKRLGR